MANSDTTMPSALDRQIASEKHDAFGHRHYARALESIVESEAYAAPFSVGLLGGWGTGKSSIKDIYTNQLADDELKNEKGLRRSDRFRYITFNAWRFGGTGQDIKRALLRHVFIELGGDDEYIKDQLFRKVSETEQKNKGIGEYLRESFVTWGMPLLPISLFLVAFFTVIYFLLSMFGIDESFDKVASALLLTAIVPFLVKNLSLSAVSTSNPVNRISLPSTSAEEYEDLLIEQLAKFKKEKQSRYCERIIVFVDDLDRLSAEEMVQGLDAIRTFMEIPDSRLPEGIGLVFVISCDESRIADALAGRHKQDEIPGAIFSQSDARRYLDRIFQFRLEIPPFPRQDMRQYASDRIRSLPQLSSYLDSENVSVESVVDRMIHVGVTNPRKALQIVNSFAQSWWIANKRETEELGSDRPGGLHEGAVTSHPISLGALSALKVSFPEFYAHLQDDPALLDRMTDVMVRGKEIESLPATTQELLKERYFRLNKETSGAKYKIMPQHRPLRQYLSSLNGLRWPPALDSFLFLSEDPITRAHGANARNIYDSLVSGDTSGVLEGFGKHGDTSPLDDRDARLLYNMLEDLRRETKHRQVSASKVIAELATRIPDTMSSQLIGQICRTLNDEQELRFQLGVERIGELTTIAVPNDQKAIASRLVDDILVSDDDSFGFLLETLELPNMDEALDITRAAVNLILPIRDSIGLEPASDKRLLAWLSTREIAVNDSKYQIPFSELESWMNSFEENLLPSMDDQYADLVAVDLQSSSTYEYDVDKALQRVESVFHDMYRRGEESRSKLWKLINRFVALNHPSASELGWSTAHKNLASVDSSTLSEFVSAFVQRLTKETVSDSDNWEIDLDSANSTLVAILTNRIGDIDESVRLELAELCKLWSVDGVNVDTAISVFGALDSSSKSSVEPVSLDWSERLLSGLPSPCIEIVSKRLTYLSEEVKENIASQLSTVVSTTDFDEGTKNSYVTFMKALPSQGCRDDLIVQHLKSIWPVIASHHANQNKYLYKVLPTLTSFVKYTPDDVIGGALQTLFGKSVGQTGHYSYIHSCMIGKWPAANSDTGPYNPDAIFSQAIQFAQQHPGSSRNGLLQSIASMVEHELVDASRSDDVIAAACSVWAESPEEAVRTLTGGFSSLDVDQIVNLSHSFDWELEENASRIDQVYEAVCEEISSDAKEAVVTGILNDGLSGTDSHPDYALELWINNLGDEKNDILNSRILSTDIDDSKKSRLWSQVLMHDETTRPTYLVDLIPQLLLIPNGESTANSVLGSIDRLKELMQTADYQSALARNLMSQFSAYPTKTIKTAVARACRELSGEASISHIDEDGISETDITILKSVYSDSRAVRKIEKLLKSRG